MIKRVISSLAVCLIALALTLPAQPQKAPAKKKAAPQKAQKIREQDLMPQYQEWLKLIRYIIKEKERDIFMQLTTDRDRDAFIQLFWQRRDPTPGTPENEFRELHIKRFQEASKKFRRGSAREGWMTDMGRTYITLGEPASIERIEGDNEVYSCEIWSYYGNPDLGQPTHWSFVFYQRGGSGEYKLYDPVGDGPQVLLIQGRNMDPFNYEKFYERIHETHPTLALVSLSIIPGDIPFNYQPSPQTTILMQQILESPKKSVNESYATHFLNAKGVVSTDYLTNTIDCKSDIEVYLDPVVGLNFVNFSMAPENISVDLYEPKNQYFCNFIIDVSLRQGEKIIFQYSKEFPVYIPEADIERTRRMGLAFEDTFPVIPGKHNLTILLRNPTNKEFSILTQDIDVPAEGASATLSQPILGYRFSEKQAGSHMPFSVLDRKLNFDPSKSVSAADDIAFFYIVSNLSEDVWKDGEVGVLIKGTRGQTPSQKSFSIRLDSAAYKRTMSFTQSLPAADLAPDYYDMKLTLKSGDGKTLDEKADSFVMSPEKAVPHPDSHSRALPLVNSFIYFYMLGRQYDLTDVNDKAEAAYDRAYNLNPAYKAKIPEYGNFLLKAKKFDKALALVEAIKDDDKLKFDYFVIKGKALMEKGEYAAAIESLSEGNRIYNSDVGLLNALGTCFSKTGQKEDALKILNASLKLNPNQEEVKKLVAELGRK